MRENLAIKDYINTKYSALFSKADYVPEWMVKRDYEIKNRRANFDYVDIAYTTVADSTIKVTDADLKDYYNRNKNKFKQLDDSRIVEYIVWDFVPTENDRAAILTNLNTLVSDMQSAKMILLLLHCVQKIRNVFPELITNVLISMPTVWTLQL